MYRRPDRKFNAIIGGKPATKSYGDPLAEVTRETGRAPGYPKALRDHAKRFEEGVNKKKLAEKMLASMYDRYDRGKGTKFNDPRTIKAYNSIMDKVK